jgi:hypothetical protein
MPPAKTSAIAANNRSNHCQNRQYQEPFSAGFLRFPGLKRLYRRTNGHALLVSFCSQKTGAMRLRGEMRKTRLD